MTSTPTLLRTKTLLELVPGKTSYGGGNLTLHRFNTPLTSYVFSHVNFYSCDFNSCDLSRARFYDCTFTHCDMRGMVVEESRFVWCTFMSCVAHGTDWSKTDHISSSAELNCNGIVIPKTVLLQEIWDSLLGIWGSRTPSPGETEWFMGLPGASEFTRSIPGHPVPAKGGAGVVSFRDAVVDIDKVLCNATRKLILK